MFPTFTENYCTGDHIFYTKNFANILKCLENMSTSDDTIPQPLATILLAMLAALLLAVQDPVLLMVHVCDEGVGSAAMKVRTCKNMRGAEGE